MYRQFERDITRMNATYQLETIEGWNAMRDRIKKFQNILEEECDEITDIEIKLDQAEDHNHADIILDARVMLADLLGDIIVYCASEAQRWNIPLEYVLLVIMQSNFSKLDAEGKPIKDARGKFLKGPYYWKPEPYIYELLSGKTLRFENGIPVIQQPDELKLQLDMDAVTAAATASQPVVAQSQNPQA